MPEWQTRCGKRECRSDDRDPAMEDSEHAQRDCCEGLLTTDARLGSPDHVAYIGRLWDSWCRAVKAGYTPEVIRSQGQALHSWSIHPLVDGCLPGRTPDVETIR